MAYFPDLTPYCYLQGLAGPKTVNIGWLEKGHLFPTRPPTSVFLNRLWQFCKISVAQTRGFHVCEFCSPRPIGIAELDSEGESMEFGSAEIRVISSDGVIYAAPNLVFHYVRDHQYDPPQEFIDAVLTGAAPDSVAYLDALKRMGLKVYPCLGLKKVRKTSSS